MASKLIDAPPPWVDCRVSPCGKCPTSIWDRFWDSMGVWTCNWLINDCNWEGLRVRGVVRETDSAELVLEVGVVNDTGILMVGVDDSDFDWRGDFPGVVGVPKTKDGHLTCDGSFHCSQYTRWVWSIYYLVQMTRVRVNLLIFLFYGW